MKSKKQPRQPDGKASPVSDPDNVMLEGGIADIGETGVTGGIGLPEIADEIEFERDDTEKRERMAIPSDLRDLGDPEGTDVGVAGGVAAGGEMGEGGRDYRGGDPWGTYLNPPENDGTADMGGTGTIEAELGAVEDDEL